jgi:adenine deaminase
VPGLIDSRCHPESSKADLRQFAAAVVHGATYVCPDVHEITNVLGLKGVE